MEMVKLGFEFGIGLYLAQHIISLTTVYLWRKFWDLVRYAIDHRTLRGFLWNDCARTISKRLDDRFPGARGKVKPLVSEYSLHRKGEEDAAVPNFVNDLRDGR